MIAHVPLMRIARLVVANDCDNGDVTDNDGKNADDRDSHDP